VVFDGDGDRVIFFDEKGRALRPEIIFGLFAQEHLKKHSSAWFVMPINTYKGVREYLQEQGAKIQLSRIGYVFMQQAMKKRKATYGVELSGHFYFKEFFYDDSALLAFLKLASLLSKTKRPLSWLVKPWERYISSGEINFPVKDEKAVLDRIKRKYRGAKISLLDGITVEYPDWWFNVRPSHTEPLVRLVLEAKDQNLYEQKLREVESLIKYIPRIIL